LRVLRALAQFKFKGAQLKLAATKANLERARLAAHKLRPSKIEGRSALACIIVRIERKMTSWRKDVPHARYPRVYRGSGETENDEPA
jgi:hypothetical protein